MWSNCLYRQTDRGDCVFSFLFNNPESHLPSPIWGMYKSQRRGEGGEGKRPIDLVAPIRGLLFLDPVLLLLLLLFSFFLQHGLDIVRHFEVGARLGPHFVDRDAVRELDESESLGEIDIEYALCGESAKCLSFFYAPISLSCKLTTLKVG